MQQMVKVTHIRKVLKEKTNKNEKRKTILNLPINWKDSSKYWAKFWSNESRAGIRL